MLMTVQPFFFASAISALLNMSALESRQARAMPVESSYHDLDFVQ
jgi:hypothetical protein